MLRTCAASSAVPGAFSFSNRVDLRRGFHDVAGLRAGDPGGPRTVVRARGELRCELAEVPDVARIARAIADAMQAGSRADRIIERIRAIPEGFVRTYGDIDPRAPRLVGLVLSRTHEDLPWQRVVRADGTLPKGAKQRALLLREGVAMRGERVDLDDARLPPEL